MLLRQDQRLGLRLTARPPPAAPSASAVRLTEAPKRRHAQAVSLSESSSYDVEVDDDTVKPNPNEPAVAAPAASAPAEAHDDFNNDNANDKTQTQTAQAGGGDNTAGNGDANANANAKRDDNNNDNDDDESDPDDVDVPPAWTTVGKGGKLASGNPHARVVCATCGRSVGGGAAGIYQHARSPYHLACHLWLRYYGTWPECVTEGQKMSDKAWEDDQKNGPRRVPKNPKRRNKKAKTGTTPPWTENGPAEKGPGGGPDKDPGPDGSGILVQMWQLSK